MRRVAVLLVLPLLMSGCLEALRCWDCAEAWHFEGSHSGLFDALATAQDVREVAPTGVPDFSHPRLDEAWGEYALVGLAWRPGLAHLPDAVEARGEFLHGFNLSVQAGETVGEDRVRAHADELLRNLTRLSADERAPWVDAMMANRTIVATGTSLENGTTKVTHTYGHEATFPRAALSVEPFFAQLVGDAPTWDARQARTSVVADVHADDWSFAFWFPLRILRVATNETMLLLQVNGHGGFFGSLRSVDALSEAEARALVAEMLREQGARGVDVGAWELRGERTGEGPVPSWTRPPPAPTPTATPEAGRDAEDDAARRQIRHG